MGARLGMIILALVVLFSCKGQSRLGLEYPKREIESICQKTKLSDFLKLKTNVTIELNEAVVAHQIYSYPPFLFIKNYKNLPQYLYDTRSKEMARIGDVGKGPGEYVHLGSIAFLSPQEFYGLARALKRIIKYRIDGKNIICEDTIDINTEYGVWFDEIYYKDGNLYCNSFSGPAGTYQVVVYDSEMNIIDKFHKRSVESSAIVAVSLFYKDMIIFLSEYNYEQKKHHDSFIYIYSLNGDLLSKIDTHEHNIHELLIDKTGKYIFAVTEDKAKIFTVEGDLVHEVKRDQELRPDCNPALRFMRTGKQHDDIIYGFQTDEPNVYKVNIYSCEIEEGAE
jgi:hypothetical protein